MNQPLRFRHSAARTAAVAIVVTLAAVVANGLTPPSPALARAAAPPLPPELAYVPHDAALFLYVDAVQVLSHEAVKGIRAADRKGVLGAIEAAAPQQFGMSVDDLKSVVVFMPRLTGPQDSEKVGFVVTFTKPFDKKKFEAGLPTLLPKGAKFSVSALNDKAALVLQNFDAKDAKPRPAGEDGPLTGAIKAAARGKHALVAGLTFANLPDELRKDNLPGPFRVAKPIFASDALVATVDLGQSLDLAVTVKAARAAQAADAEKALAAVTKLFTEELTRSLVALEKDATVKDGVTVLKALLASAKGGKFELNGTDARVTATLPLQGLPLAAAYTDAVKGAQQAAVRNRSANNLKQIGLALHNYHDTHGHFPPAAVCDKKGKPQLSWRVLILPYIEHEKLYKEFKLDEPWDGPNNKKLLAKMPQVYAIPEATKAGGTDTYYRAFVGNGAAFDWLTGTQIASFTDGTSNTVLCATGAAAVPWTKPDELEFEPEKDPTKLFGLVVNGTAQVTMCDGSVRTLAKLPSKETLKAVITRSGGEVIGNDF